MPIEGKYGRITCEFGSIGDDEPVMLFRAQDRLLPDLIRHYRQMCEDAGSPPIHLQAIDDAIDSVTRWQVDHFTKVPTSDGYERKD